MKLFAGGVLAFLAVSFIAWQPRGDAGDPAHIATFKTSCQKAVGGSQGQSFCRCMARGLDGLLLDESEFHLAGEIVNVIGRTYSTQRMFGTNAHLAREILQTSFDRISKQYHGRVSLDRKAHVLRTVTLEIQVCAAELPPSMR